MDMVLCSPEDYYNFHMENYITRVRQEQSHKWIFQIINNDLQYADETIYLDNDAWCLCLDKHNGSDVRYLVIFKDVTLRTIRDLRRRHVQLLRQIQAAVEAWLGDANARHSMYFHYMPSVFQLHLHVNTAKAMRNYDRIQPLHTVIRNLEYDDNYYKNALILTRYCKTVKRSETHSKLGIHI